jgi:hypothetical protein
MSVERAERVDDARIWQRSVRWRTASHEAPEERRGLGAMRRHFVLGKDCRQSGPFARRVGKPELELTGAGSEDEMVAIGRVQASTHIGPLGRRKFQFARAGRTCDKNNSARSDVGKPENF